MKPCLGYSESEKMQTNGQVSVLDATLEPEPDM
jgi:hypothetical protein